MIFFFFETIFHPIDTTKTDNKETLRVTIGVITDEIYQKLKVNYQK